MSRAGTAEPVRRPMSEREAGLRDAIAIAEHFRQQTDGRNTKEDWGQRRMATRIIQAIEAQISRG